jgi:hypothetical protein
LQVTRSKLLELVIALGFLVAAVVMWGWDTEGLAQVCLCLSLPLGFIWFPDEIAAFTRRAAERGSRFNTPTPAPVVTLVGWLFLVGYAPLLAYLLGRW